MFAMDGFIRRQLKELIGEAGDAKVVVKGGNVLMEDCHFDEGVLEDIIFPTTDPMLPPLRLGTMHVKRLAINIPWGNFSKGFVDIELDGLSVNLYCRPLSEATSEILRQRKEACVAGMMEQLVTALTSMSSKGKRKSKGAKQTEEPAPAAEAGGGGALKSLITGVLRKVLESFRPVLRITNVHIRYEDLSTETSSPMAMGLTVGRLFLQHPESPYSEIDEDPDMQSVKDVTALEVAMDGVGVYMHTASMGASSVIGGGPASQAAAQAAANEATGKLSKEEARRLAATNGGEDDRTVATMGALFTELMNGGDGGPYGPQQWLVRPISMSGKVHVNVGVFIQAPSRWDWSNLIVADLTISPIRVAISEGQASSLVAAGATLTTMPARYLYVMLRPAQWQPRAVLRAAMNAVRMTLISVSPSTRLRSAIRDRTKYQDVLVHALSEMRRRDSSAGAQIEDVMHVTTDGAGKMKASDMGGGGGAGSTSAGDGAGARDQLLEMDALSTPMQIALWRIVAWTQAKTAAEQDKLQGKKNPGRALLGALGSAKAKVTALGRDEMMAASDAIAAGDGEEGGDDPLAGAPSHFNLAVANLRMEEISLQLVLDDSARAPPPASADAAVAISTASSKTVTTTTKTTNLDGSVTTTTSVTTFAPPANDQPISTVLGVIIRPIVVRAFVAPKEATRAHAAIGEVIIEHSTARGAEQKQRLICFPGDTHIPDSSPLLGPPLPETEVPRPALFGFFGSGVVKKKPTPAPPLPGIDMHDETLVAPPPAIHAVVSLPPEPPPGENPPDGSLTAHIVITKGEARLAPHQLHELFHAFFTPLDRAIDLIPGPVLTREMVSELRLVAETLLTKPWWGVLGTLPVTAEGLRDAFPGLMPLHVTAEIREGITLHVLGEPPVDAGALARTVPISTVTLPPLLVKLAPADTASAREVRVNLQLSGDIVLSAPKQPLPTRPFSGPGALPSMEPSKVMPMLLSEQMQLVEELSKVRAANRNLANEVEAYRAAVASSTRPTGYAVGSTPTPQKARAGKYEKTAAFESPNPTPQRPAGMAPLDVTPAQQTLNVTMSADRGGAQSARGGTSSARGRIGDILASARGRKARGKGTPTSARNAEERMQQHV